jgi:UDP-N-acetylmuramoyl-tripeptide--D-alanyl-D-alanine ligase
LERSAEGALQSSFKTRGPDCEAEFHLPLPGRHNVANALAAIAVGKLLGVPLSAISAALAGFRPLRHRAEPVRLAMGATLIDDSYNSNPRALDQMLELLRDWPGAARRIVIAGEMLELGPSSAEWHREAGRHCVQNRVDWILAVQGDARFLVESALEAGFPVDRARFFAEADDAGRFCRSILQAGDVVLVKGSRGIHLERALEQIAGS